MLTGKFSGAVGVHSGRDGEKRGETIEESGCQNAAWHDSKSLSCSDPDGTLEKRKTLIQPQ